MPVHSNADVMDAVARHSARAAARVHQEMKRGLSSLASIAATAPFVGFFGTLIGIVNSFVGFSGNMWTDRAFIVGELSESLVPTALGLLVAIIASWFYTCLSSRLETLDTEMHNASLDLLNRLSLYRLEERL